MSSIDPINTGHPEELLEAYALDALDDDEAEQVDSHLEGCAACTQILAGFALAASRLGQAVTQSSPPASVLPQLMQSLPPQNATPFGNGARGARSVGGGFNATRLLLPLAAALFLALFSVSMVMNLHASNRMDRLEEASTAVAAQLEEAMAVTQRDELLDTVHQIRAASYLMALPETQPMILEPPNGTGRSNGVLLVGDGGSRAVLMISDMDQPHQRQPYDVWLVRDGRRVPVGQVSVDSTGWGSTMLVPPEPVFGFEWVNLTMKDSGDTSPATETMVLRSRITPEVGRK